MNRYDAMDIQCSRDDAIDASNDTFDRPAEPKCECVEPSPYGHTCPPATTKPAESEYCGCAPNTVGHKPPCKLARPTAPPAESVEDAKPLIEDVRDFLHELRVDDCGYAELIARYAEQYATKQIERQTPAIIERFVGEVEDARWDETMLPPGRSGLPLDYREAMAAVKARREGGRREMNITDKIKQLPDGEHLKVLKEMRTLIWARAHASTWTATQKAEHEALSFAISAVSELEAAKRALAHYADEGNWLRGNDSVGGTRQVYADDPNANGYDIAQKALASVKGETNAQDA